MLSDGATTDDVAYRHRSERLMSQKMDSAVQTFRKNTHFSVIMFLLQSINLFPCSANSKQKSSHDTFQTQQVQTIIFKSLIYRDPTFPIFGKKRADTECTLIRRRELLLYTGRKQTMVYSLTNLWSHLPVCCGLLLQCGDVLPVHQQREPATCKQT